MKQVLRSSVSIIALSMMINTAWGMNKDSDEEEGPKGRYSVGKDWDESRSVASNAFSQQSNRTAKKEELSYDEQDEWERGTVRTDLDDVEVRGQKLTEITDLKKHFFKGNLEITPQNYETLTKHTKIYATAFKMFDKGVVIKGWKASLGFESLSELLYTFVNLKTFKANIQWDKEEDVSETIARAIQFYENLTDLDIANCKLTDESMVDIRDSIQAPEKLKSLDVRGNKLSKDTLTNLKEHFSNLASFKSDTSLEAGTSAERTGEMPPHSKETLVTSASKALPLQQEPKKEESVALIKAQRKSVALIKAQRKSGIDQKTPSYMPPPLFASQDLKAQATHTATYKTSDLQTPPISKVTASSQPPKKLTKDDIVKALNKVKTNALSMKDFVELLNSDSTLTQLDLRQNGIGNEGAKSIAKGLATNKSLTHLYLGDNNIGVEGAKSVAKALETNITLTTLNLSNNNIGGEGAKSIAKALETNNTLTDLSLKSNKIGDEGAKTLAKALEINKTLTKLNLEYNQIGFWGKIYLWKQKRSGLVLDYTDPSLIYSELR